MTSSREACSEVCESFSEIRNTPYKTHMCTGVPTHSVQSRQSGAQLSVTLSGPDSVKQGRALFRSHGSHLESTYCWIMHLHTFLYLIQLVFACDLFLSTVLEQMYLFAPSTHYCVYYHAHDSNAFLGCWLSVNADKYVYRALFIKLINYGCVCSTEPATWLTLQ